ncbi:MAG: AMP-binding protein [Clostridia bacterium]|nr:AMP-binding protein [Clostridia bacterium]
MDRQVTMIAERIRGLRKILGKSVEDMAAVTGISAADYERCENGENDFSFTFLHKCAKEFGVDITALITGEEAKLSSHSVVRAGEGLALERRKGFKYNHLASFFKGRLSEPFMVVAKYDPAAVTLPIPTATHEGEEFDYILRGKLKVVVNGHEEILGPGDAIYYNSSEPHGMIAWDGEDCEFLAVVTDAHGRAYDYAGAVGEAEAGALTVDDSQPGAVWHNFIDTKLNADGVLSEINFKNEETYNFAYDTVDAIAAKTPDRPAMYFVDKHKNGRVFTFGDMSRESARTANYFASLGIGKGDRVMLVLKRHYQFWFAILALHKLGAVVVPATNLLMKKDFTYRFNAGGIKAIVMTTDGDVAHEAELSFPESPTVKVKVTVGGKRDGWNCFDEEYTAYSDIYERPVDAACGSDNMLMFFTSGTTGYPKIAMHSYKYALGHFITAKYWHHVDPEGIHFTISDTGWGKALWGKLYGQWLCEAAVFTYDFDKFNADDILPMFKQYGITTFCAPPTMYRFFIKEDLSKYDLTSLKYATTAGEALNPEVYYQFEKATGLKIMEGFGQTETTLTIANLFGHSPRPGSMGKASPLYDIDIVVEDENGNARSVKNGETGEVVVRTDRRNPCGLYLGYYNDNEEDHVDKELTAKAWHDDMYHTGDMAWRDEDGYFWYVGRIDDLIKSSGYRIGPFEIESVIMELPYVLECAITAAPDEIRGQVVKATIVPVKGTVVNDELKKDVQNYVKTHTAPYKYPRIVEFVDELPKTISGKIKRVDIRKEDENK